jgi:hypothetical protein
MHFGWLWDLRYQWLCWQCWYFEEIISFKHWQ